MARPKSKTCKQGHAMKGKNLFYRTRGDKQVRECRACANQRARDRRAKLAKGTKPKSNRKTRKAQARRVFGK